MKATDTQNNDDLTMDAEKLLPIQEEHIERLESDYDSLEDAPEKYAMHAKLHLICGIITAAIAVPSALGLAKMLFGYDAFEQLTPILRSADLRKISFNYPNYEFLMPIALMATFGLTSLTCTYRSFHDFICFLQSKDYKERTWNKLVQMRDNKERTLRQIEANKAQQVGLSLDELEVYANSSIEKGNLEG